MCTSRLRRKLDVEFALFKHCRLRRIECRDQQHLFLVLQTDLTRSIVESSAAAGASSAGATATAAGKRRSAEREGSGTDDAVLWKFADPVAGFERFETLKDLADRLNTAQLHQFHDSDFQLVTRLRRGAQFVSVSASE